MSFFIIQALSHSIARSTCYFNHEHLSLEQAEDSHGGRVGTAKVTTTRSLRHLRITKQAKRQKIEKQTHRFVT